MSFSLFWRKSKEEVKKSIFVRSNARSCPFVGKGRKVKQNKVVAASLHAVCKSSFINQLLENCFVSSVVGVVYNVWLVRPKLSGQMNQSLSAVRCCLSTWKICPRISCVLYCRGANSTTHEIKWATMPVHLNGNISLTWDNVKHFKSTFLLEIVHFSHFLSGGRRALSR